MSYNYGSAYAELTLTCTRVAHLISVLSQNLLKVDYGPGQLLKGPGPLPPLLLPRHHQVARLLQLLQPLHIHLQGGGRGEGGGGREGTISSETAHTLTWSSEATHLLGLVFSLVVEPVLSG